MNTLRKFLRQPAKNRWMLVKALAATALIGLGLRLLPFSKLLAGLNWLAARPRKPRRRDPNEQKRVVWAVAAATRRLRKETPCLTQALAVHLFLRRRGLPAQLRIGVAKDDQGELRAHAWVESNQEVVIGGAASPREYKAFPPLQTTDR